MLNKVCFWSIATASFIFCTPTFAETLTDSQVRAFLEKENKLLKDTATRSSPTKIRDYLETHLTSNFSYTDEVTSSLGHFGSSTETLNYKKDDYIQNIVANIKGIDGVKSDITFKRINISRDGQSANVHYKTVARLDADGAQFQQKGQFGLNTSSDCEVNLQYNFYKKTFLYMDN